MSPETPKNSNYNPDDVAKREALINTVNEFFEKLSECLDKPDFMKPLVPSGRERGVKEVTWHIENNFRAPNNSLVMTEEMYKKHCGEFEFPIYLLGVSNPVISYEPGDHVIKIELHQRVDHSDTLEETTEYIILLRNGNRELYSSKKFIYQNPKDHQRFEDEFEKRLDEAVTAGKVSKENTVKFTSFALRVRGELWQEYGYKLNPAVLGPMELNAQDFLDLKKILEDITAKK